LKAAKHYRENHTKHNRGNGNDASSFIPPNVAPS
jgi:hypothetical protein